jgi:hypothetical protein
VALSCDRLARHLSIHPFLNGVAKWKKLNLQTYQNVIRQPETQLIEITCFPDRHFWHGDYDKAVCSTRRHGGDRDSDPKAGDREGPEAQAATLMSGSDGFRA